MLYQAVHGHTETGEISDAWRSKSSCEKGKAAPLVKVAPSCCVFLDKKLMVKRKVCFVSMSFAKHLPVSITLVELHLKFSCCV